MGSEGINFDKNNSCIDVFFALFKEILFNTIVCCTNSKAVGVSQKFWRESRTALLKMLLTFLKKAYLLQWVMFKCLALVKTKKLLSSTIHKNGGSKSVKISL